MRIRALAQPKYTLFENVSMSNDIRDKISQLLGMTPVRLDSSLLSAQHRVRLYWTDLPAVDPPVDFGLAIMDILDTDVLKSLKKTL